MWSEFCCEKWACAAFIMDWQCFVILKLLEANNSCVTMFIKLGCCRNKTFPFLYRIVLFQTSFNCCCIHIFLCWLSKCKRSLLILHLLILFTERKKRKIISIAIKMVYKSPNLKARFKSAAVDQWFPTSAPGTTSARQAVLKCSLKNLKSTLPEVWL